MRAALFANGNLEHPLISLDKTDLIVAADAGARHCLKLGIWPAFVLGDFDSLTAGEMEILADKGAQLIQYPRRKDYTDLELALQHISRLKQEASLTIDEIVLFAALGSRWDQTIGNLLLAASFTAVPIRIAHGIQEIRFLHSGEKLEITGNVGDTVSIIPLSNKAARITIQGMEYPLRAEDLDFGSTRGISNVLTQQTAEISLSEGLLAVTMIHHGWQSNPEEPYENQVDNN